MSMERIKFTKVVFNRFDPNALAPDAVVPEGLPRYNLSMNNLEMKIQEAMEAAARAMTEVPANHIFFVNEILRILQEAKYKAHAVALLSEKGE